MDEQPKFFPLQTETEDDADVPGGDAPVEGREIPEGQIAVRPMDEEQLNVNAMLLRGSSSLAALRAGCSFSSISSFRVETEVFSALGGSCKETGIGNGGVSFKGGSKTTRATPFGPKFQQNLNRQNTA